MCEDNLPFLTSEYINSVFSIKNLAEARGPAVPASKILLSGAQQKLRQYLSSVNRFRQFYFTLGSTAISSTENNNDSDDNLLSTEMSQL